MQRMEEGEVGFEADPGGVQVDQGQDQEEGMHFGHLLGEGEGPEEGRGEPSSTTGPDPLGETKGKRANQGQWLFSKIWCKGGVIVCHDRTFYKLSVNDQLSAHKVTFSTCNGLAQCTVLHSERIMQVVTKFYHVLFCTQMCRTKFSHGK